jgi:hypothetical protein
MAGFTPRTSFAQQPVVAATMLSVEGSVELLRAASTNWTPANPNIAIRIKRVGE